MRKSYFSGQKHLLIRSILRNLALLDLVKNAYYILPSFI